MVAFREVGSDAGLAALGLSLVLPAFFELIGGYVSFDGRSARGEPRPDLVKRSAGAAQKKWPPGWVPGYPLGRAGWVLQTIPGIGPYRSLTLVGEITPIERFPSNGELVSFVGLAPINRNTAGKVRHPGLSEDGNRRAKDVLESAVLDHHRCAPDSSLSEHYDRKVEELGRKVGQTDTARKLTRIVYAMLSTGEVWRG